MASTRQRRRDDVLLPCRMRTSARRAAAAGRFPSLTTSRYRTAYRDIGVYPPPRGRL